MSRLAQFPESSARTPVQMSDERPSLGSSLPTESRGGWLDRTARRILLRGLADLRGGQIVLRDGDGRHVAGRGDPCPQSGDAPLDVDLQVHRPAFYRHAVLGGSLSVAESYLRGDWSCDDLTGLFRLFTRNVSLADRMDRGLVRRLLQWPSRLYHWAHANSRSGSQRNIHLHYDLGNDFFRLMLDPTMAYSSGIYPAATSTLEQASVEKMDRLCRRLALQPGDHLLEIGTGWGGLAIHAARNYGCRVTTTTISQEQFAEAKRRVAEAGLSERITLLLQDYRDLEGQYDKLVSVEMVEAVGHAFLETYVRTCSRLLKPNGSFALQGIVMNDQRHEQYVRSVDFIQRYVFPGGCLPSVCSMMQSVGRGSDLRLVHLEDFAGHYARTLADWRTRFFDRLPEVRQLGYSERFVRLWDYYLCYCEAAFAERYIGLVQMVFDKPGCRRDISFERPAVNANSDERSCSEISLGS